MHKVLQENEAAISGNEQIAPTSLEENIPELVTRRGNEEIAYEAARQWNEQCESSQDCSKR
jgi:hypothetical protein